MTRPPTPGDPEISVVVPARDVAPWVEPFLTAMAAQDPGRRWELIVVDHGSTDGTVAAVERWRDRLDHLRVLDARDAGTIAGARNAGAAAAHGSLLAFTDADDVVSPGWLRALADGLLESDLVSGPIDVTALNPPGSFPWAVDADGGLPVAFGLWPFASSSNLGVRRRAFEELGGFDATLPRSADVDFSWRARLAGLSLEAVPDAIVHRRLRGEWRALFRQHLAYGVSAAALYGRYRGRGMPRASVAEVARELGFLVIRLPRLRDPSFRRFWAVVAGRRVGRAVGSLRWRVLYL